MVGRPDRPTALGLRSYSHEPPSNNASVASLASASMSNLSIADLPSPRAGDAPPALSPLDALALQGRLLAKRFEQADKSGRRLSRLAPLTIQNEFGNRSGFFSSLSSTAGSPNDDLGPISAGGNVAPPADASPRQHVSERHKSFYPQISNEDSPYAQSLPARSPRHLAPIGEASPASQHGYFDIPRSRSPDSVEPHIGVREATPISPMGPTPTSQLFLSPQRKPSTDSMLRSFPQSNLLLPRKASNHSQRSPKMSPSMRSVQDSSDEVDDMPLSGSYDSLPRNRALSPSSSLSCAQSPFTPTFTMPRSPSAASARSLNGDLPRPAFNFSRPISRQSTRPSIDCVTPSLDMPSRHPSDDGVYMRPSCDSNLKRQDSNTDGPNYANDTIHTPVSMVSEDFRRSGDYSNNPAPSYIHTTFDLPRGRKLDRRSIGIDEFFKQNITWEGSNGQQRPPSPDSPPRSFDKVRSPQAPSLTSSNSTIRAATAGTGAEVTAQQHCDMGIELHEKGELLKSTYHLRLAARGGLPEAMLWYGLACRHGWGMRENKAEALQWLRRAVDSGHLEIADDEQGQSTDITKKKQHRAQYAVAIYELGKCYMNGWGAAQDKPLALRCYEIAGNWGDPDALVEAGYCYAEGVGCRKDMKRAAKFYRAAEAKGVSMVGNSWIYKDKYSDDATSTSDSRSVRSGRSTKKDNSEKKSRDKSRTRTIFGRKKSHTASST